MSGCYGNVVAGNDVTGFGKASRRQEFFHRKVREFYKFGIVKFDNGEQTGAREQYGTDWIF